MTDSRASRFGHRILLRTAVFLGVLVLGLVMSKGTAAAGVDNASSVTDVRGNRIEVLQGDTQIRTVPPLDNSPLTVEFFHDGYSAVGITGPDAADFKATKLTIGYQVGYPVALAGATIVINTPGTGWVLGTTGGFSLEVFPTPTLEVHGDNSAGLAGDIIPSQELDIDLEPGGITTVPILENQPFDGPSGQVRFQGVHGHVQGAIGPVTIRPYATATAANGDTVTTYGVPQKLN